MTPPDRIGQLVSPLQLKQKVKEEFDPLSHQSWNVKCYMVMESYEMQL